MTTPTLKMPTLPSPKVVSRRAAATEKALAKFDAVIVLHDIDDDLSGADLPLAATIATLAERAGAKKLISTTMPGVKATLLIATRVDRGASTFEREVACRKAAVAAVDSGARRIAVVIHRPSYDEHATLVQSAVATLTMADFSLPKFSSERKKAKPALSITVFEPSKTALATTIADARGNCLARWLTAAPPNLLDAKGYRALAAELAKRYGFEFRFHSLAQLKRRGAGAFVAVAQGNGNNDAGIVQLSYRSASSDAKTPHVALIGKGIIFDTGGTNLKPHNGMLAMHMDMGGSAVALGSLLALAELGGNLHVDCWLAITENRSGPDAFKPQDVVTALNGTTIQTIHTDAEGRMVLADTLTLAAREKPKVMLDFATLTGTCISAVTTRYSGVFSNRASLHALLKCNGEASGERVWPFPIGGDFAEALKSETADTLQCPVIGSGDHIMAATFLEKFVPSAIPWVHMDLSACEHKGGLGAVSSNITGFGVRYTTRLLREHYRDLAGAKSSS